MPERRQNPRFLMDQAVRLKISGDQSAREFFGYTVNASAGGAYLLTNAKLAVGSEIVLTMTLFPNVVTTTKCRVLRVTPARDSGKMGVAVECLAPFEEIRR